MIRTVRTTVRPDQDVQVDAAEYLDLARMGLLAEPDPPPPTVRIPRDVKLANPVRVAGTKE